MEQTTTRTIDEQGRVTLSRKLLQRMGWGAGDELAYNNTNRAVILSMQKRYEGPRCGICYRLEQHVSVGGVDICGTCLQEIVAADAMREAI